MQQTFRSSDPLSGNAIASFLLGVPGCIPSLCPSAGPGRSDYPLFPFFRQWYYAPFVQDDWKVTSRLTLNLGLRWDFTLAPDEKYGRLDYRFDPNAQADPSKFPELANYKGGLTFGGEIGRASCRERGKRRGVDGYVK